jgi:hypothetical protein
MEFFQRGRKKKDDKWLAKTEWPDKTGWRPAPWSWWSQMVGLLADVSGARPRKSSSLLSPRKSQSQTSTDKQQRASQTWPSREDPRDTNV